MSASEKAATLRWKKEAVLFGLLLLFGVAVLPFGIYVVGNAVFGAYGGGEYRDFHIGILTSMFSGHWTLIFLVLSPYLMLQTLRLSVSAWRRQPPQKSTRDGSGSVT